MADYDSGLPIRTRDGLDNPITSETNGSRQALDVFGQNLGPVTGGTAASYSGLVGGQYNSTPITLTTGQQAALQLTASGALIVSATLPYDTNWGTVDATTLRVAAELGNASGLADFGAGATDAQTLRVSANQGATGTASTAWFQKITDGTNVAAVKAASTAAIATDPALVVAISPNNTVAVTQSTSPWVTSDLADGSVTGGAAGTKSMLSGGIYNSSAPTLTTGQQASLQLDVSGNLKVDLATSIPAGGNLIGAVNLDVGSAPVSSTNPVPVYLTDASPGTPVNNYQTSVALAAGSTVNLTYTVPAGKTFSVNKFWVSASGKIKAVFESSPDGSTYSNYWVGFNSTANPNIDLNINSPAQFQVTGSGSTIRIAITNNDLQPFDVYATISGSYQ